MPKEIQVVADVMIISLIIIPLYRDKQKEENMRFLKVLAVFVVMAFLTVACGGGGDGDGDGGGIGSGGDPSLLVGTWDMTQDEDGDAVPSGTATLNITSTTYSISFPGCDESGTYTASGTALTLSVGTVAGTCGDDPGDVFAVQYSVNSTTLTLTDSGDTMTWSRL
jgi:hypothetical protein